MEHERTKVRKAHKKSRNGCLPCKARHVKCDETKPNCVHCQKYDQICAYPVRKTQRSPNDSPDQIITTPSSVEGPPSQPHDHVLNIDHLRLLHHFTTVTAKTLTADPEDQDVHHTHAIKLAFDFPFLLEGVLALAALHLSRLEPSFREKYLAQAQKHHAAALSQFRSDITDLDASNFEAVFYFAATLDPYSFALSVNDRDSPVNLLDNMIHNFALTRRVRPMVSQYYPWVQGSELHRIVPKDVQGIDLKHPPSETELSKLRRFSEVTQHIYPADINEAYGNAIQTLEVIFDIAKWSPKPPSDSLVKIWIYFITPRFLELLSERQPGALVIFAHYAVLFKRSPHYWFFDGLAERILGIATALVPIEWSAWLNWPKEQIRAEHNPQEDTPK
ncbi:hypothetical protein K491DRAFT_714261 [Lophiostoma macrostomum CBS 122681]|uniref:Zn(2)-C6 fungal-type domain-containing protein n=1 Tax=Lophiostoma macrostomum CBS 122681 TaxID=1314788 RepID=A0A6A6TE64_9PLEO|nr:hypothetical protein K491DRAFT_714261 [Lophiostoma macrostomum CBS 122681]